MRRILVVDDTKMMQQLVGSLLAETGAALDFASSASEALFAFQQHAPDLVISDIEMPGMSGVELAERIRRESLGRTKVVLMSAGDISAGRAAVTRGHADAFLPKPLDTAELRRVVEAFLGMSSPRQVSARVRVLVADDTLVGRRLLERALGADPDIDVVGVAADGEEAVRLTERLRPSLVLLDAVLPKLDGIGATREIMRRAPTPVVLLTADLSAHGAKIALDATQAGALDFLTPPAWGDPSSPEVVAFREKLKELSEVPVVRRRGRAASPGDAPRPRLSPRARARAVVICGSTGGPGALSRLLRGSAPAVDAVGILVVQHIMSGFAGTFAEWLTGTTGVSVQVAEDGDTLRPGRVLLAPDGHHLLVESRSSVRVSSAPPVASHRPSGTLLFESAARAYGRELLAVLLTGMGEDGVKGLGLVRERGGAVLVQSPESCVVPGMPEAAIREQLPHEVLGLDELAAEIVARTVDEKEGPP
jgi:two-component system chemotaxis response regulator CheB